jgi:hypothetical protein
MPNPVEILKGKFSRSLGQPWQEILPTSAIEAALESSQIKYRDRFYNPIVTLWVWIYQVLDSDKSSSNAVSRVIAWLAGSEAKTPSSNTGGYTKAKQRLPENFLKSLFEKTGESTEAIAQEQDLWCGRHVVSCLCC